MSENDLASRLKSGGFVLSAWSSLRDPAVVEGLLRGGFDAVTFDMQHGFHDIVSLEAGITRAALLGRPALVRMPLGDRANAARALDFGASGVIMPMIETAADAAAFAAEIKYPPLGRRSFGPGRAAELLGHASAIDYTATSNSQTLAFAMIETRAALDDIYAILAIDGIDGVFVGPSDLSISLSPDGRLDPGGVATESAVRTVAAAAKAAGKVCAIYAVTAEDARRYRGYGFQLVCLASDVSVIATGAGSLAAAARA